MFLSLQIKTAQGWQKAVLPQDASINVEDTNPIFDTEAGDAFSYPFTLNVEANQHLFPTLSDHHGAKIYDLIYHKPFRLSADGYPLLYGIIDLEDEVEIEKQDDGTHTVSISLASNNQELKTLLDDVNAQEIPVKDKIPVGTEFRYLDWNLHVRYSGEASDNLPYDYYSKCRTQIPAHIFSLNKYKTSLDGSGNWINSTNVSDAYPTKPYCNARVAVQAREKQSDGNYVTLREYEVFDADRPNSGICFYVQYFLDCLFNKVGVIFNNDALQAFEDFNRLAFFNTKCECDAISTAFSCTQAELMQLFPQLNMEVINKQSIYTSTVSDREASFTANAWTKYANSKNFPDTEAFNIITELQNAFGVRFLYDSEGQRCQAIFIKDIFNDLTSIKSGAIIHDAYHKEKNIRGVKMTYGGSDDDTSYNYDPNKERPASPVIIRNGYAYIRKEKGAYDRKTYYDSVTGNWFRIKVDEDAKTEDEWYPSLFEVGQFQDAWVGNVVEDPSEEDNTIKEITVGFTPVICNIVGKEEESAKQVLDGERKRTSVLSSKGQPTTAADCQYAVFLDLELEAEQELKLTEGFSEQNWAREDGSHPLKIWMMAEFGVKFTGRYGYSSEYIEKKNENARRSGWERSPGSLTKPVVRYDEDPLSTYDAGFTLGIMRGPGNDAGADVVNENYDGNGNARWAFTPTSYAFTSDSIDHFGNLFDYNGQGQGGIDPTGRVSLKLQAEKVCNFQGKKVENGQVLVSTPQEAAYWLTYFFPDSCPDLLALRPQLKSAISAEGWSVAGYPDVVYLYPVIRNGKLCNIIEDDGNILTSAEIDTYTANLPGRTGSNSNRDSKNILIKEDAVQQDITNILALVNIYYFPDASEPYLLTDVPATATTDFYPIASQHAHRGLLHKFNYEYFWFLIHSRTIVLDTTMTLQELRELDKTKWHTFGQYTGLIEKLSYDLDNEKGLSHVEVTLLYL